jgi:thioredoxin-dependent peroxiredoxin
MKIILILFGLVLLLVVAVALIAARSGKNAPATGTPAPDFTLKAQDGKPVSLRDFRGKWVVLYFYPKDFTSGCTKEARNFQRDLKQFEEKNAVILGVSGQDSQSHEKFCAAEGLHFKLLADTNYELSTRYDSQVNLGVAKLSSRHTFLIDPSGVIRKVYLKVDPAAHSTEILSDLAALQNISPNS